MSVIARQPVIALLTDFGTSDTYVGVMKAVIASRSKADVIDLTHDVMPQNIQEAAYLVSTAHRYLPKGSVLVCVVDPGVGTSRRPIAVGWPRGYFVGPDNGWLSYVVAQEIHADDGDVGSLPQDWQAVELTEQRYWLDDISSTFHGRDVFAPVAAALANGTDFTALGQLTDSIHLFALNGPMKKNGHIEGEVIHVDHFGNVITNVSANRLEGGFTVSLGTRSIDGPATSYVSSDPLVALINSNGYIEIAAPNGSAANVLDVTVGTPVLVDSPAQSPSTARRP